MTRRRSTSLVNTLSRVIGAPGPIGFRIEDFVDAQPESPPQSSVLIVDDDAAERLALRSILAPLGHPIVEATSGDEARRCISSQDFAVVLLDVRTSSIDGFETAAFIRSREASRLTPVIFLTTIDRAEKEMTVGYAMGAVDFVVAPLVPAALRGKVSLFADLFAKTQELVERARRLRIAATRRPRRSQYSGTCSIGWRSSAGRRATSSRRSRTSCAARSRA